MSLIAALRAASAQHAPDEGESLSGGAVWRSCHAHDADELASQLTGWDQRYDQLSCGRFDGDLAELRLPQVQLFRERISRAVSQSCTVRSDSIWVGLVDLSEVSKDGAAPLRIDGHVNPGQSVLVRPGDEPFELVTPDAHRIFGIVVQRSALMAAAERHEHAIDCAALGRTRLLDVDGDTHAYCVEVLRNAFSRGDSDRLHDLQAPHIQALQSGIVDIIARMLDGHGACEQPGRQSIPRRHQLVTRAREHVLAHRDRAMTMPELCEHLHVSRRTLQYCFEDVLGVGPLHYLRAIRLNGARRHLREAAARHQSVQDVAVHWGFWHFSQFACDYRKLFGESPSATLKGGVPGGAAAGLDLGSAGDVPHDIRDGLARAL